jgi:hypothetical protein
VHFNNILYKNRVCLPPFLILEHVPSSEKYEVFGQKQTPAEDIKALIKMLISTRSQSFVIDARQLYFLHHKSRQVFAPWSVHVRSVVDKVALGHVFLRVSLSPVSIIPTLFRIHLCIICGLDQWRVRSTVPPRHSLIPLQK